MPFRLPLITQHIFSCLDVCKQTDKKCIRQYTNKLLVHNSHMAWRFAYSLNHLQILFVRYKMLQIYFRVILFNSYKVKECNNRVSIIANHVLCHSLGQLSFLHSCYKLRIIQLRYDHYDYAVRNRDDKQRSN